VVLTRYALGSPELAEVVELVVGGVATVELVEGDVEDDVVGGVVDDVVGGVVDDVVGGVVDDVVGGVVDDVVVDVLQYPQNRFAPQLSV